MGYAILHRLRTLGINVPFSLSAFLKPLAALPHPLTPSISPLSTPLSVERGAGGVRCMKWGFPKGTAFRFSWLTLGILFLDVNATTLDNANKAYEAGNFHHSIKLYRKAALEGESPALCYFNAANAYFQMDSLAQAIVFYRACIQNAPDFLKAHLNLAVTYYSLNDLGRCLAAINRTLEIEPEHEKALLIQATTLRRCGAIAKAVVAFENCVRLHPHLEEPYIALGELYQELGDPDEAIRWLEAFPIGGKNSVYVDQLLSTLYEKAGDVSKAIFYLNQAFNLDKSKRWMLYHIAQLQQQSGNNLVALETCRDGLKQFPDFAELSVLAGTITFEYGRMEEAERFFTEGVKNGSAAAIVGLSNVRNRQKAANANSSEF